MVTAPPSDQELMSTMMTRITLLEQKVQSQSKELTEKVNIEQCTQLYYRGRCKLVYQNYDDIITDMYTNIKCNGW